MGRLSLRFVALGYLTLILIGPLAMMVWRTAEDLDGAWTAITHPDTVAAFALTLKVAAIAVSVNTVFGIVCALVIVRGNIPGHEIEHPMAVVILGGLLTSTVLNLFLLPTLYARFGQAASAKNVP